MPGLHTQNGSHGSLARRHGLLHQLPAAAHGTGRGGKLDGAGSDVSRVLPERMPGKIIRGCASFGQNTERRNGRGEDRRLGELSQPQLLFGSVKTELRQVEAERVIGFLESLARDRESRGEVAAHADALGTLTRE